MSLFCGCFCFAGLSWFNCISHSLIHLYFLVSMYDKNTGHNPVKLGINKASIQ